MKDQYNDAVDPRDLTSRLHRIQKSHSEPNDGDYINRLPRYSRAGTSSSSSTPATLPFRKSTTMSTTASDDSRIQRLKLKGKAMVYESKESVEIGRGEFSKPRLGRGRKRCDSEGSRKEHKPEFQYYGRHANSWLFNDFSITDSVKKGWERVVHGKEHE